MRFWLFCCWQVVGSSGQVASVNAADADIYDEEAERKAFQEAVNSWRKGNAPESKQTVNVNVGKVLIEREYETKKAASSSGQDNLWHNPFADNSAIKTEQKQSVPRNSGSLNQGTLDEEQEHAVG